MSIRTIVASWQGLRCEFEALERVGSGWAVITGYTHHLQPIVAWLADRGRAAGTRAGRRVRRSRAGGSMKPEFEGPPGWESGDMLLAGMIIWAVLTCLVML